jgi:NAD(P)-dependent dehydrogenase (short-subunit alcohol dehydrogenase family)
MYHYAIYPSLAGKAVFITGGATGIGASLVRTFAQQGCHVAFVDIAKDDGEALAAELRKEFTQPIRFATCDVTRVGELRDTIASAAAECGDFTVLVNNVANDRRFDAQDMSEDDWKKSLSVNLDPAFFAAQAVYPMMLRQGGGSIINFSSINAIFGPARMPSYNTAKAGLLGLTKSLARDWGPEKIRVNAILPGWVITEKQLTQWLTPEIEQDWMKLVCLKDRLLPEDVANLTLFLAADDSRMITSQSFVIDGGRI